jgi:CheY-like chemotaxis protein
MEREIIQTLLVEPDPKAAALLEGLLSGAPLFAYQVTAAASLAEARERLRGQPWDVVLVDLALPNGQGAELVRAVKELAADAAVVALTARDDEELAVQALRERAQECLARDRLDGPGLLWAVRCALERGRAEMRFRRLQQTLAGVDRTVAKLQQLAEKAAMPTQAPPRSS